MLFHIFLPFTLPYIRLRETFCQAYSWWLRKASALVGLEDYLLPPRPAPPVAQNPPVPPAPPANHALAPRPPPAAQPPAAADNPDSNSRQDLPPPLLATEPEPLLGAGHPPTGEVPVGTGDPLAQDALTQQLALPPGAVEGPAVDGPQGPDPGTSGLRDCDEAVSRQDRPGAAEGRPHASAAAGQEAGSPGEPAGAVGAGVAPAQRVPIEDRAARHGFGWASSAIIAGVHNRAPSVFNADGSVDEGLLYRRLSMLLVLLVLTLVSLNVAVLVVPILTGESLSSSWCITAMKGPVSKVVLWFRHHALP